MYSSFLFLLLVFLIPNISLIENSAWIESPHLAFVLAQILYAIVLALIFLLGQSTKRLFYNKQSIYQLGVNILLITYQAICFFGLESQRFYFYLSDFQLIPTLWAICFYLFGLWLYYYSSSTKRKATQQIRFLIPFALPFVLFTLILDLFFSESNPYLNFFSTSATSVLFLFIGFFLTGIILIFFPAIIQSIWQCKPLSSENPELTERLELICKNAHFKHAGIKIWTVMNDSLTAAIIGVVPRFRYIIFTKRILKLLSAESIEAILAHEIGHSYWRHLLIYPLIILGMILCLSFFETVFQSHISPFLFFILYILIIVLYLRIIFGFFSRNFERQADLHVFQLGIQPKYMIDALHKVAVDAGNIHLLPSWHHYSIQERINFLNEAISDPDLIKRHHLFVKRSVIIYLTLLTLAIGILWTI